MRRIRRVGEWAAVLVVMVLVAGGSAVAAEPAWETKFAWKNAAVGEAVSGTRIFEAKTATLTLPNILGGSEKTLAESITLTGGGVGVNVKDADQCSFVYIDRKAGDFEIIVRLTNFAADADAPKGDATQVAGIMVRQAEGDGPNAAMVALFYNPGRNAVFWRSRVPAGKGNPVNSRSSVHGYGVGLAEKGPADKAPIWLRLVRMDKNFAVYKSRDGKLWTMIHNCSGGPFALEGPLRVGVFCTSGAADKMATATFDAIQIGDPHMRYKTSWVGNSFGYRMEDGHVSNTLSAMWVAADGTCYTSSYWDEAGQPVTSYRDGKVLRGLPIGTPQTAQGGITGDGQHLYVATVNTITELDPAAADRGWSPRVLVLSIPLLDQQTHHSVVSGMASDGKELFVADKRENLIRVVTLAPPDSGFSPSESNNVRTPLATATVEVPESAPEGAPPFAPAIVYQSQRAGEGVTYNFPGLTPGGEYTIRCHMAEFVKRRENADDRNFFVSIGGGSEHSPRVYVAREAGGENIALAKDFPGFKAGENGNLRFHFGTYGGPGLCGIEVIDAAGKRVAAVNCGGPDAGDFKGECPELLGRNFAFANPGVMVVDKRGNLWIIQRLVEDAEGKPGTQGAVRCFTTDGKFTGREITDVINPTALAYDAAKDQLLVGEGLPDVNVRVYGNLADKPKLERTFGEKGGIYAGKNPGLVYDPAAGGYARFAGINGLGVDAKGNLYVGGGWQGTDLRMFTPDGKPGWKLFSLLFCNTYDVDPASDGADIYATYNHVKLDLNKTAPGSEQTYIGYNWDWRNFGEPVRQSNSQAMVKRMGKDKRLILFTSGQGHMGDVLIYRYEGELAIPCGAVRENGQLWIDADGDGKESPGETVKMDGHGISSLTALCIDSQDNLWIGVPTTGGSFMRKFTFKGFNDKGVPLYGGKEGEDFEDIRFPDEGATTSAWGMRVRLDYDADRDIMILYYPSVKREGEGDKSPPRYKLARYDNWSKGNREATWKVDGLTPYDPEHAKYFMYETDLYPYGCHMGMQFVGDYVFFAHMFGEVFVHDAKTGEVVEILSMGPEVAGNSAWEDASMGLRAFKRKNGEYLIFTENSGWAGRNNFFRWTPEKK